MLRPFCNAGSTVGVSPGREQRTPHSLGANAPTPMRMPTAGFVSHAAQLQDSCGTFEQVREGAAEDADPPTLRRKKALVPNTPGALPYS
jgi:hypothetical protein